MPVQCGVFAMRVLKAVAVVLVLVVVLGAGLGAVTVWLSPWPGVIAVRAAFGAGAAQASRRLEDLVPRDVKARLHIAHAPTDPEGRLDLYLPPGPPPPGGWPVVVWVHGGAWVSGSKADVGNYLRILAARGFATVGAGYTVAPRGRHPVPARQVTAVLAWVARDGAAAGLNPARVALAGDSTGAQIAAQAAIAQVDPAYAARLGITPALPAGALRGVVLFCGGYDPAPLSRDGLTGLFVQTILWAYLGRKDWQNAPDLADFTILPNLPAAMPPLFISAGDADPLLPQSRALAEAATTRGIATDTLFFVAGRQAPLGHEYQFDLTKAAGQTALDRMTAFLTRVFAAPTG